jgi:hypothetical protein
MKEEGEDKIGLKRPATESAESSTATCKSADDLGCEFYKYISPTGFAAIIDPARLSVRSKPVGLAYLHTAPPLSFIFVQQRL